MERFGQMARGSSRCLSVASCGNGRRRAGEVDEKNREKQIKREGVDRWVRGKGGAHKTGENDRRLASSPDKDEGDRRESTRARESRGTGHFISPSHLRSQTTRVPTWLPSTRPTGGVWTPESLPSGAL